MNMWKDRYVSTKDQGFSKKKMLCQFVMIESNGKCYKNISNWKNKKYIGFGEEKAERIKKGQQYRKGVRGFGDVSLSENKWYHLWFILQQELIALRK